MTLAAEGRFSLRAVVRSDPYWLAEGDVAVETNGDGTEAKLFARTLAEQVQQLAKGSGVSAQMGARPREEDPAQRFADQRRRGAGARGGQGSPC